MAFPTIVSAAKTHAATTSAPFETEADDLVLFFGMNSNSNADATGATFNGDAMDLIHKMNLGGVSHAACLYSALAVGAADDNEIAVTWNGGAVSHMAVVVFRGVHPHQPLGEAAEASQNNTDPDVISVEVADAEASLGIGFISSDNSNLDHVGAEHDRVLLFGDGTPNIGVIDSIEGGGDFSWANQSGATIMIATSVNGVPEEAPPSDIPGVPIAIHPLGDSVSRV